MHRVNSKEHKFVKIVYIRVQERGKQELVPLKLYADGSLEPNR
jgi:hypothetical protein